MHRSDIPDAVVFNATVIMNQNGSLAGNQFPRHFGMFLPDRPRDLCRRLTDNLDLALNGRLKNFISEILFKASAGKKTLNGMSQSSAASRSSSGINNLLIPQDRLSPIGIDQTALFDEVHVTAEQTDEFLCHRSEIPQVPGSVGVEGDDHIDIAVRLKVRSHCRAEQCQFSNSPLPAECGQLITGKLNLD